LSLPPGPLSASLATAVTAGIASFLIVLASAARILKVVPATFCGFASTFAYLGFVPGAFSISAMTAFNRQNAIVVVPISLMIGTRLGVAQGWLARVVLANEIGISSQRALRLGGSLVAGNDSAKVHGINS
jgi:hypothetical protein